MQALDLLPLLIQTVEKAASQSTQVPIVTEGVAAALLLSKLSTADSQAGKEPAPVHQAVARGLRQGRVSACSFLHSGCIGLVSAEIHLTAMGCVPLCTHGLQGFKIPTDMKGEVVRSFPY